MKIEENYWRNTPPSGPFIRPAEAAKYLGLGLSTYYALAKQGQVPSPIKITQYGRASGVPKNVLDAFIISRAQSLEEAER